MGTQGPGRKRIPNKERLTAEDDALNVIAKEAEARLAAKRAARAEAREIRMKELERQQKEVSDDEERMSVGSRGSVRVDDRLDRDYSEKGSRVSTLSSATLASLDRASSRRGSGDTSITADTEVSMREIKDTLAEMEEKYRKAMVSNAQLDNEKCNLMYQVDIQKDSLMELEELLSETRREYEEKAKELEREKYAHGILQFQFNELKQTLKQSEELLTKHGIVLGPDWSTNGETGESLDGSGLTDSNTKTSPTEGSSVLGRSEEKQPGVVEAAEGSKPNQLDEAVPQNHVTPPSPSGPASVVETCQSEESEAPLIGNKEEIESGNTVDTELKNQHNDSTESVQSAALVNAGSEDEVTIEEKVVLEASGSNLENSKPSEEVKEEMGSSGTDGQDPKTERELYQKVEAVCAGEPATEITCEEVEQINETDKSESGNVIAAGKSAAPVPEIIISMAKPEETSAEVLPGGTVKSSSSDAIAAKKEESQQAKTEAEAVPVSEEETAEASQTPVKQPQQPQGGSASGKKKKKKKKGKQKQKGGAQGDVKQDKDPKPQVENPLSEDPGQKTREENSKEKAAGSCEESIQESPVGAEADSIVGETPETDVKNDGASKETENVPCLQTSNSKDDRQEEPAPVTSGDSPTEINPESDIREHSTSDLESKPDMDSVSGHAECILNKEPIDSTETPLSEDKDCCDSVGPTDDQNHTVVQSTKTNEQGNTEFSLDVSESIINTDVSESCPDQQVKVDDLPCNTQINAHLSVDLETQSAESKLNVEHQTSDCLLDASHDCLDSELSEQTPEGSPEFLTGSVDANEQGNTDFSLDVSESIINTDVSESCPDQQVKVDDLPCNTQINAHLSVDLETQSTESKLNVEHQTSDGLLDATHDCLDSELSEETPEGSPELLTGSVGAPSQFDGSESTETSQGELTLHSEENNKNQDDTEESLSDVGGNGTETQPDVTEEATDASLQSKEIVQLMASEDDERDMANEDQPAAIAPSDDCKEDPREESLETNDPAPKITAEDEEEDEAGEEFQFDDQDFEELPDSPKRPLTERTDEELVGSLEEENEEHGGYQGQDKENNSSQEQGSIEEQNNVEQQEVGEKTVSEKLDTRQDPTVTEAEEGSAGKEPSTGGTEERETSGVQNNPATTEQPLSSTEIEAEQPSSCTEIETQTAERGVAVSGSGDSEGASQVAVTESGGQEGGPTRKDSKKGSKKNKGKGKEDCKMS